MHRRLLLCSTLCIATWLAGCSFAPSSYTLSQADLQTIVAKSFPREYPMLGLVSITVQAPTLQFKPETNRINATMTAQLMGKVLPHRYDGGLDVDFALRYEPSDRTVRAVQLHFQNLQFPSLQPAVVELLATYGPALAAQALQEVVLHQLKPQDLALPDTMGLQPGSITVTEQGLVVGFVNKPL